MFTDSCDRVLTNYCHFTGSVQHIVNLLTRHSRQKMTAKHRSANNVLWRVVMGRIRRGRGPDSARGPPVGQPWSVLTRAILLTKMATCYYTLLS